MEGKITWEEFEKELELFKEQKKNKSKKLTLIFKSLRLNLKMALFQKRISI